MRTRFKRLKNLLEALRISLDASCDMSREEVQAGVFLTQLLRQDKDFGGADVTEQVGYHFGWYGGPFAPDLEEDYRELVDHIRFERATNGIPLKEKNSGLEEWARQVVEHADHNPADLDRATWLSILAAVAYLRAGAGWESEGAKEEFAKALGSDYDKWFSEAEAELAKMSLLELEPA